jgi:hypothetical protein
MTVSNRKPDMAPPQRHNGTASFILQLKPGVHRPLVLRGKRFLRQALLLFTGERDATQELALLAKKRRRSMHSPRQGWKEAFAKAGSSPDQLLLALPSNEFDAEEWTW